MFEVRLRVHAPLIPCIPPVGPRQECVSLCKFRVQPDGVLEPVPRFRLVVFRPASCPGVARSYTVFCRTEKVVECLQVDCRRCPIQRLSRSSLKIRPSVVITLPTISSCSAK